jgi:Flp pilus assembly protein TadD
LELARRLEPDDPGVLYDLAVAYVALDRPDDARRVAEHLLEVRPGDAGALRLLERTGP